MKISALVPTLMLGATLALPASVLAQDDGGYSDAVFWAKCQVAEVATLSNRVHVKCAATVSSYIPLRYFASPTSNSAEAARLVAMGTAALMGAGAGHLWVLVDISKEDAASYGCSSHDCRRPINTMLLK